MQLNNRVLAVAPQAWPVASALDAQVAAAVHEAPVAADDDRRDITSKSTRMNVDRAWWCITTGILDAE